MRRARYLGLIVGLLTACSGAPEDTSEGATPRGPLGKADLIGSCAAPDEETPDSCGGKSDGNCWCDDLCEGFGDCCDDYAATCEDACEGQVVCALFCEFGFKVDEDGCEICECQGQVCGGIAALQCPEGQVCVGVGDFPDASGFCEPEEIIQCGGFAGLQCPEGLICVDVPGDGCDPQNGGADCGGMCVEDDGPTCEGACGGMADGGGCYCDDLCEGFGDCCDDYEAACVEPEPNCGDESCDAGEVCVTHFTQLGFQHSCAAVPGACDGEATCACMGDQVCTGAFNSCGTFEDGLSCSCPTC